MKNRIIDVQNIKITVSKEELDESIAAFVSGSENVASSANR